MTPRRASDGHGVVPLSALPGGAKARLVRVDAGTRLRSRLMAMGLRPGTEVRVIRNGGRGPFVFALGDLRMVLGRGMAHKCLVAPIRDGDKTDGGRL